MLEFLYTKEGPMHAHQEWHNLLHFIPFLLSTSQASASKLNVQRIVEALIIAAITGGVALYAGSAVLESRLNALERNIEKLDGKMDRLQIQVYQSHLSKNGI